MVITELEHTDMWKRKLNFEFSVIEAHPPFIMYSLEMSRVCKVHIYNTSLTN
jgi:hypothetical protein